MSDEKSVEQVVAQWVRKNEERYRGDVNRLKRCASYRDVKAAASYRVEHLMNRMYKHGHSFSRNQMVALGWAFSHVRQVNTDKTEHADVGRFLAGNGLLPRRLDFILSPEDREGFIERLVSTLDRYPREYIPIGLAKSILYYGPDVKFEWRRGFDNIEMVG